MRSELTGWSPTLLLQTERDAQRAKEHAREEVIGIPQLALSCPQTLAGLLQKPKTGALKIEALGGLLKR